MLITLVILPVLPDRTFGPFDVLNPHRIWLMVALIVGISLGGYVCYKFFGARAGAVLAGILGGTISSTATTVSYARQARQTPGSASLAAFVIMVASAVVFARVLILCATVAPQQFVRLAPPVAVLGGVMALVTLVTWFSTGRDHAGMGEQANPTQLRSALVFGALFAVVLFAVAAVRATFGEGALFAVAILSGATDMDAITLSTAQMVQDGRLGSGTGWRLIVAASLSNLVFKAAAAGLLGGVELFRRLAMCFGSRSVRGRSCWRCGRISVNCSGLGKTLPRRAGVTPYSLMRIIGGSAGGLSLKVPKGYDVRPTPDLVRQAVFNSLGERVLGARVLELFGGTGALSLECLSRGAARATVCVELSRKHARFIEDNFTATRLPAGTFHVRVQDVFTALPQLAVAGEQFDLILADPPYGEKNVGRRSESFAQRMLDHAELPRLVAPGGLFVLGHARRDTLEVPPAWTERKFMKHGDSIMRFLAPAQS